jgi:hypothetical protein
VRITSRTLFPLHPHPSPLGARASAGNRDDRHNEPVVVQFQTGAAEPRTTKDTKYLEAVGLRISFVGPRDLCG